MGNYGIAVYGDGDDFYGNAIATGLTGSVQWIFLVDWDGDGTFAYNEAAYLIDLETSRGERYFVQPNGSGFETIRPGEGTATLTDKDRRFDPDNASGALYEKILPGRKFILQVKYLATGVTYPVMAGFINDIPPITEIDQLQLKLRESWSLLDEEVSIPILYRNSIADAMTSLLTGAEWPVLYGSELDAETQQITAFTVDKINALDTFIELGAACLGQVFSDNTGKLKFYSRGHSTMASVAIDQAVIDKQIRRSQPWENLRNIIHVTANKKVKSREAPIWQNSGPIQIAASSTVTLDVQYKEAIDVRVYSMIANSMVNGKGINMTSYVTYTLDVYPASLKITFTNSSSRIAYITQMVVVGREIVDQPIRRTVTNALSTASYGKMVFDLDNPWLQDLNHAGEFATMISNFLDEPQRTIEIQIEQRPDLQYSFDVMDKIPFTSAKLGIDTTYYAGLIAHRWMIDTGQAVKTTVVLRPRLTDATSIANDPEDPDLPYIPEPPFNPGLPITLPPTTPDPVAPGGTCLTDPAAAPNGPFTITGIFPIELISNGRYYFDQPMGGLFIRPADFVNTSYMTVLGDWQIFNPTTGEWDGETSTTNWRVMVNVSYDAEKRAITDQGSGNRTLDLKNGGAQELRNIRFEIDPTSYGRGLGTDEYYSVLIGRYTMTASAGDGWVDFNETISSLIYAEYVGVYVDMISFSDANGLFKRMNCDFWNNTSDEIRAAGGYGFCSEAVATEFDIPYYNNATNKVPPDGPDIHFQLGTGLGTTVAVFDLYMLYYGNPPPAHRWYIRGMSLFNVCSEA